MFRDLGVEKSGKEVEQSSWEGWWEENQERVAYRRPGG